MQPLLFLLAVGAMNSHPACSYKDTVPLVSLADVREAVPIGMAAHTAKGRMILGGFVCEERWEWAFEYNRNLGLRSGTTTYLECSKAKARGRDRKIRFNLLIVDGRIADICQPASHDNSRDSRPFSEQVRVPMMPEAAFMRVPARPIVSPSGFQPPWRRKTSSR